MFIYDVSMFNKRSSVVIDVKCDLCENIFKIKYINYTRTGNHDGDYICRKCKTEKTNLEKYGVKNISQSKDIKELIKKTNIKKFGKEYASQNEEIKEKRKNSVIEKYGVENVFKSEEIKEKIIAKIIEKWGVNNISKLDYIKKMKQDTCLKNHGVKYPLQNIEILRKMKDNNLLKYGVEYTLSSESVKTKIKSTNLEKYGVANVMMSDEIKQKLIKKNIEKYGCEYYYQTDEFKNKSIETNIKKYGKKSILMNDTYRKENFSIAQDINYIKYIDDSLSLLKCDSKLDHMYEIHSDNYFHRKKSNLPICTVCYPIDDLKSIKEKELYEYISSMYYGEIIQSYRDVLEIDIYLPELKLGFEFNGLYWHSEEFKDKWYHLNKTNYFKDKGIRIIHIWEDDWDYKNNIIKSQINNWLGISENKIYAKNCEIKEISNVKIIKEFLQKNHIQGYTSSIKKIGIYYNNELVGIMTFDNSEGRKKMESDSWNLSRFCNKTGANVVGGASKLLKYFIKTYSPCRIISYADKDWSIGELYNRLGFIKVSENKPDYKYIIENKRIHKSRYRKSNLKGYLSESEQMKLRNILKIWDCGKIKFELKFN